MLRIDAPSRISDTLMDREPQKKFRQSSVVGEWPDAEAGNPVPLSLFGFLLLGPCSSFGAGRVSVGRIPAPCPEVDAGVHLLGGPHVGRHRFRAKQPL